MELQIGKSYRARNGSIVTITANDAAFFYGMIRQGDKESGTHSPHGYFTNGTATSLAGDDDLVEELRGTDGRVYGGDPNRIHVKDQSRDAMGMIMAQELSARMRLAAHRDGMRTIDEAVTQPLCPGCYMVVAFDMLTELARMSGQSMTELGRTMCAAFAELEKNQEANRREEINILLDPEI
jgi:hypothetical protein